MSTKARFTNNVGAFNQGTDNTDRVRNNEFLDPVFAATIALKPKASYTLVKPGVLTGALTMTADVGSGANDAPPFVGDKIEAMFTADATGRTVTFGTGFVPNGALVVAISKKATASFMFDGAAWLETGRVLQP
jgi:hypothetical protein